MDTSHSKYSESRQKGNLGEDLACLFLMKQGFKIVERNYLKPWGEIDIVAKRSGASLRGTRGAEEVLHFVEVKSVSCEIQEGGVSREIVTHETLGVKPEENMTPSKLKSIEKAVKTYLIDHNLSRETPFQVDLVTVRIDRATKTAIVERFEKIS